MTPNYLHFSVMPTDRLVLFLSRSPKVSLTSIARFFLLHLMSLLSLDNIESTQIPLFELVILGCEEVQGSLEIPSFNTDTSSLSHSHRPFQK